MKRVILPALNFAVAFAMAAPQALAYTSLGKVTFAGSGSVTASTTFSSSITTQGNAADPAATLAFEGTTQAFRDSGESVKVNVTTNVAGNRVIFYTDNSATTAVPRYTGLPATGLDGGGLVGQSDTTQALPILWKVSDTNVDATFTPATLGDDETYLTDRAHTATFTPVNSALDNLAMKNCATNATVANTAGNGLYPQFFGGPAVVQDLCRVDTSAPIPEAQELSKNIAVMAFGFNGTAGTMANLQPCTSPIYAAIGADFTPATAQTYATNTLAVELVTQ